MDCLMANGRMVIERIVRDVQRSFRGLFADNVLDFSLAGLRKTTKKFGLAAEIRTCDFRNTNEQC